MIATRQSANGRPDRRQSLEEILRALSAIQESRIQEAQIQKGRPENSSLREKLLFLEKKLASNHLHLAVLGQMKRGKSSFINALLGEQILPTGILPVTAIITEIRYGERPQAAVLYSNGQRESVELAALAAYITEAGNPGNKKQVASVEIAYPSPFLASGMILIDTPGIGSTHAHNTRTTESYLAQVDAGIVVFSVDPPITEVESQFLKSLQEEIPKFFFILNKIDSASDDEVSHISCFLGDELSRLYGERPEIFCLSARRALEDRRECAPREGSSGIEAFASRLRTFLAKEKGQVLVRSVAMDALHIARTLKFAAAIGARAQVMSPEEITSKKLTLDRLLKDADSEMHDLQALVRQHSVEIVAGVERSLSAKVAESVPVLQQQLKQFHLWHPTETGRAFGSLLEGFLMQQVEAVFRSWRTREDQEVQAELDFLAGRFVARANSILEGLQQAAGVLFEIPVERVSIACPLRVESRLYYRVERIFDSLDSFLLALPGFLLRPIVLRKTSQRVWQLLDMNAGRIRYDYVQRLQATMNEFERNLAASVAIVTESLRTAFENSGCQAPNANEIVDKLESISKACVQLAL